ncbi:MAG: 4Fe-4S dicluster domain-containing protein [Spirochaetes bacterium]|nr:4Fe-4S dicluster domain-containing protein [Spirochaetota bacterium]
MLYNNTATHIRRELLVKVASMAFRGTLTKEIDRIPFEMIPKEKPSIRCCIHHDRVVIKYRLMAMLGFALEKESDELRPLSSYAEEALDRVQVEDPVLTVIDEACSACVQSHYFVTNACRGCVARPCVWNCPKKAIQMIHGQARIDASLCVNCGLCQKVCPYHAIVKVPIPCEEACPVGAISKSPQGKEQIDFSQCIYCGKCMNECPFGAIVERSQILDVIRALQSNKPVIALVAPAMVGQFPGEYPQLVSALRALGFHQVYEVAHGADETIVREAKELVERIHSGETFMTTSCCPAYTRCVGIHVPELKPYISTTKSPMLYAAEKARQENSESLLVFIGPCVAKKGEALQSGMVDYVLNTEELGALLVAKEIDIPHCEPALILNTPSACARAFPIVGNVSQAVGKKVRELAAELEVKPFVVDGMDRQNIKLLRQMVKTKPEGNLVEVMACQGGCVAGPAVINKPVAAAKKIEDWIRKGTLQIKETEPVKVHS